MSLSNVCNGRRTCKDGSDEVYCATCPKGRWKCKDVNRCIDEKYACDGEINDYLYGCPDDSDEDPALCQNFSCTAERSILKRQKCKDNITCVYDYKILDGKTDCPDGSDEQKEYYVNRTCPDEFHLCDNGQCIRDVQWCNGVFNCQDHSDEGAHCEIYECLPTFWKCADNRQCIDTYCVCDGGQKYSCQYAYASCNDRSDENNTLCGYCTALCWLFLHAGR